MKLLGRVTGVIVSIFAALDSGKVVAQQPIASPFSNERAAIENNCESNIDRLNNIDAAGKAGLIIVIARLGDHEFRKDLNSRRLHNVRAFLREFQRRDGQTIITAEGDMVKGRGRVEFYVEGKLIDSLGVSKNEDLFVGTCEWTETDKIFFDSRRTKARNTRRN
jgi:hypothetical protein